MHEQVLRFLRRIKNEYPKVFQVEKVLECGSLDINGTPRDLFETEEYIGLDWREGKGVDEVSLVHEYRGRPDGYFGTIVSTEMLEHDPYWEESLFRMIRLLAPRGSIMLTCAGPHRPAHEMATSPERGYYRGLGMMDLLPVIRRHANFRVVRFEEHSSPNDTYAFFHLLS